MCGIAGYFGTNIIDENKINGCLNLMRRRGPDFAQSFHHQSSNGKNIYLLHSRLSIIDLDKRSHQPYYYKSKVLAYNGEIYNYIELRNALKKRGLRFDTDSDTEVLIKTIDEFGWEGLDKCEGMWAFAIYDKKTDNLLLSRDRFGEKPLYLYKDNSGLYFASEIKFIFSLLDKELAVNENHLFRYMINGYKSLYKGRETFFQGIEEMLSGSILTVDALGKILQCQYWKPSYQPDESLTYEGVLAGVREELLRSVKMRLRADVPLSFCMSGGIDSNALISIAKNVFNYDVHGFTIINTDSRYEEQEMVEHAVKELGIRYTHIPVNTNNFLPQLRTLVRQHDAPVYTITYYAQWLLMDSVAKHGYRISISGTAADELFSGYYDHHIAYLYEVRHDRELYENSLANWKKHIKPIVRNPHLSNPNLFIENASFRNHIFFNADGFSEFFFNKWSEDFTEESYSNSLLRNRMLNELFHENVPPILHEDDLNAMYFSIENRSPFLDRGLFDFCNKIPTKYLVQNGYAKAVLRDAMRGIVPEKILNNHRKVGFNAPIFSYLDINDSEVKNYLLDNSKIYHYIDRQKIENMISKETLTNSQSKFLFYFLNSKIFLEEHSS